MVGQRVSTCQGKTQCQCHGAYRSLQGRQDLLTCATRSVVRKPNNKNWIVSKWDGQTTYTLWVWERMVKTKTRMPNGNDAIANHTVNVNALTHLKGIQCHVASCGKAVYWEDQLHREGVLTSKYLHSFEGDWAIESAKQTNNCTVRISIHQHMEYFKRATNVKIWSIKTSIPASETRIKYLQPV
jgi:hypothetical protein